MRAGGVSRPIPKAASFTSVLEAWHLPPSS